MRKLLQNKAVVSGLCAIAVLCAAGNFVKSPVGRLISAAARPVSVPATLDAPDILSVPPVPRICADLSNWHDLFPLSTAHRDPFAIVGAHSHGSPSTTNAPPIPTFALQAVSIEAGRTFVVINQTVLAPGERLGDYVLERILPTEVWLKNGLNQVILQMNPRPALRTKTP